MVVNAGNVVSSVQAVAERYRAFSWQQARGRSDAHEELTARISQDPEFCDLLSGSLPAGDKQQPYLLLAAVRYLDGPHAEQGPRGETAYGRWREWTIRHWDEVRAVIMRRANQTADQTAHQTADQPDEPARCATLLPLLARLPQPLALLEVGAPAGLCLYPDRYRYRFYRYDEDRYRYDDDRYRYAYDPQDRGRGAAASTEIGAPESPVTFECHTSREAGAADPVPVALPGIVWRAGIARDTLDPVGEPDDLRWLQALLWPGDAERTQRLSAAVDAVRPTPRPRMVRGDLLDELPALAAQAPPEATLVVFHTAVLSSLPLARREEFARLVRSLLAARERPGHWISNEHHTVLPWITAPAHRAPHPGDAHLLTLSLDERPVALTAPHGQSLHWLQETEPTS